MRFFRDCLVFFLFLILAACVRTPELTRPSPSHAGFAEWELWRDWPGDSLREALESPRWREPATRRLPIRSLESARDVMDDFAVRISGKLIPPQSGPYTFLLETRGEALFRLNGEEILFATTGEPASRSIRLSHRETHAFELLHKGGAGPVSLRLGWILPDGTKEMPIGGSALASHSPWEEIRAENMRRVLIDSRLRTYDAERNMALHPHNPRPGEHIVRETFYTAGALLESDDPEEHEEAFRAILAVIGLQNTYEPSNTFGNWPRVVQQPGNFNAQNIGGFIGAEIIMILQRHDDKLPEDLREQLRTALRNAAHRSRRYNPPVTATNIVTKAVAVALVADAMLDIPEARAWGETRLRELHAHTLEAGMPTEYNSPTYNRVTLEALSLLRAYYQNEELSPLIDDLYEISWQEMALNYHPNLQLWIGNAARSYDAIHHPGARLQEATDFSFFFGERSASRLDAPLPQAFQRYLKPLVEPETREIPVLGDGRQPDIISQQSPVPLVSTVHLDPGYALASFNRGDLWNQRRALTLTWGRRDHAGQISLGSPSGAQGLLAVQTTAAQEKNRLLLFLNFATDAGWGQHPWELFGIDRENPARNVGEIRARFQSQGRDRPRFEIHEENDRLVTARAEGVTFRLRLVDGAFETQSPRWELTRDGHLDLVIRTGDSTNLHEVETAFAAVALEVLDSEEASEWLESVEFHREADHAELRAGSLILRAGTRPASYALLQTQLSFETQTGDHP